MTSDTAVRRARVAVANDPSRRQRVDEHKRRLYEGVALRKLRQSLSITQEQLATLMDIKQESVSQIERRDEILLSTLIKYVGALGGRVEITAILGEQRVELLSPTEQLPSRASKASA